jgi:glycosyltransferase involved in cell wall biosynthesis
MEFAADDDIDLARKVCLIIENDGLRKRLSAGARATVERAFRFEKMVDAIEQSLLRIVDKSRRDAGTQISIGTAK